jgi:tetratricopeptide (TPR) repeat protein
MKRILILFVLTAFTLACGNGGSDSKDNKKGKTEKEPMSKEEMLSEITKIEKDLEKNPENNYEGRAERLAKVLNSYADAYPQDSLAPEKLFKSANVFITIKKYDRAVGTFNRIAKHYSNWIKVPETVYMTGFVYEYHMNQKGKAKEYYEKVIDNYPDHVFAKEARVAIQHLGKTDEELIEEFEAKNKAENKAS